MDRRHFATQLNNVLGILKMTHEEFGKRVTLSQPAITRLIGGKPASRDTYKKIFDFFRPDFSSEGDQTRRTLGMSLIQAYFRDEIVEFGLVETEEEILDPNVEVISDTQRLAGSLFKSLPWQVILALWASGSTAAKNDAMRGLVMAVAEACLATPEGAKIGFPAGYFKLAAPKSDRNRFRLIGGSLGSVIHTLAHSPAPES